MTAERRLPAYPLEALHRREGWRLDALRAELGAASRKLLDSNERYDALCREYKASAAVAAPIAAAAIDPVATRNRLLHLSGLHGRMKAATQAIGELEQSRERIRADSGRQSGKLESIDRHRRAFLHEEAARAQRQQGAEADRDWLARTHWRQLAEPDLGVDTTTFVDAPVEDTP